MVFPKNGSWSGFGAWRDPETYFEGWENSVQTAVPIVFLQL